MHHTIRTAALTAVLIIAPALSAPAFAGDLFGAIAYAPQAGAWGWSKDYATQEEAEARAMQECESRAEGNECQIASWFSNACGALANGPEGWGADWGNDKWEAAAKALERCSEHTLNCKVKEQICVGE